MNIKEFTIDLGIVGVSTGVWLNAIEHQAIVILTIAVLVLRVLLLIRDLCGKRKGRKKK